jgi:uncharacterized Tic20 family protein
MKRALVMNNYLLLVVLPNICCLIAILGIAGTILGILGFMRAAEGDDYGHKLSIKQLIVSMLLIFISCFIPTKQDIIELKIISVVSGLKGADKIPQNIIDKLNDFLELEKK